MASLESILVSEASLLREAALALPHSFDRCTHPLGPIRQAVYLCLTCAVPRGLCSACSVACHGDHEQIELFPKRAFVCDCPAQVGGRACTLHKGAISGNEGNTYGQNFEAKFCRCSRPYDAKRERETMVQCLVCEDWLHESCLNLRTRPAELPLSSAQEMADEDEDINSNVSNDLPPPLIPSSAYESLICGGCVLANDVLRRWAGTKGVMMVVMRDSPGGEKFDSAEDGGIDPRWRILDGEDNVKVDVVTVEKNGKPLHDRDAENDDRPMKKLRMENGSAVPSSSAPCLTPPPNPLAQRIFSSLRGQEDKRIGEGDIFLAEGWRERWCRCAKCLPALQVHPYFLEEEITYEPPEDPDSGKSLEELGMRALQNLPRDRAIDGIRAYNAMRDELMAYLRPFAEEGRIVREEDVREFFETKVQAAKG